MRDMRGVSTRRYASVIAAVGGLVCALVSLAPVSAAAAGDSTVYVRQGMLPRTALLHVPTGLGKDPPIVVVLHGGTGTASQAKTDYHWDVAGDTYKFVVVYGAGVGLSWNAGDCCGYAFSQNVDDVGFLDALINKLIAQGSITNRSPIYATGISNGAMMAYRWACEGTKTVVGLGIVSGSRQFPTCASPRTPKIVAVHGDSDFNIPEDGNQAHRTKNTAKATTLSVNTSMLPYLTNRGCNTTNAPVGVPAYNLPYPTSTKSFNAFQRVKRGRWDTCKVSGTVEEKFVIAGGGHSWPCGEPVMMGSPYDPPSLAMSATLTLVKEWGLGAAGLGAAGEPTPCNSTNRV